VFDERAEGGLVGDVEPVRVKQWFVHADDRADGALEVDFTGVAGEFFEDVRHRRDDDAVDVVCLGPGLAVDLGSGREASRRTIFGLHAGHARARLDVLPADGFDERVEQATEAAVQIAQHLAFEDVTLPAELDAAEQPRGADVRLAGAELRVEQRFEERLVDVPGGVFAGELLDGDVLEVPEPLVGVELRNPAPHVDVEREHPQAELVVEAPVGERKYLPRLVHRVDDPLRVVGVLPDAPLDVLAQSQFLGEFDDGLLRLREVVVELLDGVAGRLVHRGQSPQLLARLEDADLVAALLEPIRRCEASNAATDDTDHTTRFQSSCDLLCVSVAEPASSSVPLSARWNSRIATAPAGSLSSYHTFPP